MTLSICQEGIKHLLKIARAFLTKPLAKLSLSLNKWRYLQFPKRAFARTVPSAWPVSMSYLISKNPPILPCPKGSSPINFYGFIPLYDCLPWICEYSKSRDKVGFISVFLNLGHDGT